MAYLSIRCQRLQSLSSQRLKTSEVLEVMNDHDLMDLLRAKTDGDLDQVRIPCEISLLPVLTSPPVL
jgi:hypothetical protein